MEDVPRLFEIWRDAVAATHEFLSNDDRDYFSLVVRDQYLPASSFIVAVDDSDRPMGFLGMKGAKIDSLFVAPEAHRRGIGRELVNHAGQEQPHLSVDVNEQNKEAVAFYERLGFCRVARSETDDSGRPYPLLHMEL